MQVLFSLLCARLITPMLAAYFLRPHKHVEKGDGFVLRLYTRLITWSVRHRFITIAVGLIFFIGSIWSTGLLPSGFLPDIDKARSLLAIELPPGSQLSDNEAVTDNIVRQIRSRPEVASVFVDGGRIPPRRHRGPQGHADDQLRAESRNARSRSGSSNSKSAATSATFRTSASGSSTRTASATSR